MSDPSNDAYQLLIKRGRDAGAHMIHMIGTPPWEPPRPASMGHQHQVKCEAGRWMPGTWLHACLPIGLCVCVRGVHSGSAFAKVSSEVRVRATRNEGDLGWGLYTMPPPVAWQPAFLFKTPRADLTLALSMLCSSFLILYGLCWECRESGLAGHGHELRHRCCALYHWFQHI